MHTIARTPTTDMEVTSIRLERELKEKLKTNSKDSQGWKAYPGQTLKENDESSCP